MYAGAALAQRSEIRYFLPMRRIILVAFEGATTLDLIGPAEVFGAAARRLPGSYRIELGSVGGGLLNTTSQVQLASRDLLRLRPGQGDTVIVSGAEEHALRAALADAALLDWLRRAAHVAERVASVCSGAFVLAAAGLLDGRRATTHWSACERLAKAFPRVQVDANAIFVVDRLAFPTPRSADRMSRAARLVVDRARGGKRELWTSAGVTTGIDMSLAIVEHDHGRALADAIGAALVLYVRRPGFQSQFSDGLVAQLASSDPLGSVITWIRAHLREANVETVAHAAALSVRTLHRRCAEHLGITPAKLVDRLRIEHARTLLATSDVSAKALAEQCGFGTATNMKRSFDRELGMGPREYRLLHARPKPTPLRRVRRPRPPRVVRR